MRKALENQSILEEFGKALDRMRKQSGISLSFLAEECHMSLRDVNSVKKG